MDSYELFLDLLCRELGLIERLLDLARQKRREIFAGAGDRIDEMTTLEESIVDGVLEFRKRRREILLALLGETKSERPATAPGKPFEALAKKGGQRRYRLLKNAPDGIRPRLEYMIRRGDDLIMDLRRETKINHTLLSDRIRAFDQALRVIQTSVSEKQEYDRVKSAQKPVAASTPSVLLNQVV